MRGTQIAALSALAATALAHPRPSPNQDSSTALQPRQNAGNAADRFRPKPQNTKYYKPGAIPKGKGGPNGNGYVQAATDFVKSQYPDVDFRRADDHYVSSNGIGHVYFKQTLYGFDIAGADINVNVNDRDGSIFSWGGSFYPGPFPEQPPASEEITKPQEGLQAVVDQLALPIDPKGGNLIVSDDYSFRLEGLIASENAPSGKLVFHRRGDSLVPAWEIETDVYDNYLTTYLAADSNEVLAVTDYVQDASYEVFAWPLNDPRGNTRTTERFNQDPKSSFQGWHTDDSTTYDTTRGNNAIAQENTDGSMEFLNNERPFDPKQNFNSPWDAAWEPEEYLNASITQLFYTSNKYHDVLYQLGFNEPAGNFQDSNFGRGGKGGDSIILNTQDGSGTNNANFRTPPDGQQGRMRMYRFTLTSPARDSSFEAGIVIHEFTHGLTNRMTGGPANARCLSTLESGGMGEGWSDFYATAVRVSNRDTRDTDYPIGDYATGFPNGIRAVVYSTSMETNPYTYSTLNSLTRVHQYGTVWASVLYEVLWNLIDAHGHSPNGEPRLNGKGVPLDGKFMAMKLVLDGLALQPCSPTFLQARDAIIDADTALNGGQFKCELWKAFAKRGLGEDASDEGGVFKDGFSVPGGC